MRFRVLSFVIAFGFIATVSASAQICPVPSTVGVVICAPTAEETVSSPVHISAAAKGNAEIRAWIVYVDGTGVWSPDYYSQSINPQLEMAPGQHRITAKAWDVNGQSYWKTVYINVSNVSAANCKATTIGVHICSPANDASVQSPVTIIAAAKGKYTIRAWRVYLDGKDVWAPDLYSQSIAPQLDMTIGRHRVTAKAWDTHGNVYYKTIYVNVLQ